MGSCAGGYGGAEVIYGSACTLQQVELMEKLLIDVSSIRLGVQALVQQQLAMAALLDKSLQVSNCWRAANTGLTTQVMVGKGFVSVHSAISYRS